MFITYEGDVVHSVVRVVAVEELEKTVVVVTVKEACSWCVQLTWLPNYSFRSTALDCSGGEEAVCGPGFGLPRAWESWRKGRRTLVCVRIEGTEGEKKEEVSDGDGRTHLVFYMQETPVKIHQLVREEMSDSVFLHGDVYPRPEPRLELPW